MREYEIVYIFRSNFTPEEIEAKIERYHAILTGDGNGEITAVEQWGKRQLAYPIQKQPNGYYVVAQFTADPAVLPELERVLTLEEDLLRYLIVLSEGELPTPGSMQSAMDDRVQPRDRGSDDEKRPEKTAEGESAEAESEEPAAEAESSEAAEGDDGADDETEAPDGDDGAESDGDDGDASEEAPDDAGDDAEAGDEGADEAEADAGDDAAAEDNGDDEAEEAAEKED